MERGSNSNGSSNTRRRGSFRFHLYGDAQSILHWNRLEVLQVSHDPPKRVATNVHHSGRGKSRALVQLALAGL